MTHRLVVIGGDAAGMSAASTAKRRAGDAIDVVVYERTSWTSYSACGIPYWIAGDVDEASELIARTPEQHRANDIDLHTGVEVTAIDPVAHTVTLAGGATDSYDSLLIATGAEPIRPDLPGIDAQGIFGVKSITDGEEILGALGSNPQRAVVVGSGYVGLEMAEACVRRGLQTTVIDRHPAPLSLIDTDLGALVAKAMVGLGIDVQSSTAVMGFEAQDGRVTGVVTEGRTYPADLVILGIGVAPRTALARAAGLPLGPTGALKVGPDLRVEGQHRIWAAGDCVESFDRVTKTFVNIALGTHANKQGLVAGQHIAGAVVGSAAPLYFQGVVGTAVTKICEVEIGRAGLSEEQARVAGFHPVSASIEATTRSGYMPGAKDITVKLVADRVTRRVLGVQIVGGDGSALRIDIAALALWNEMTVDDLMMSDLAYAPPFSPVWDPVQVAARAVIRQLGY
ncbi:FAD-dependent oxidoreductase [soil metagenome]